MKARPFDLSIVTKRQIALFKAKVDRSGPCWLWPGRRDKDGYCSVKVGLAKARRPRRAHRLAWLIEHPLDTLGPDECVLHKCDNPPCVRPSHLFIGTRGDNNRDRNRKGRQACGADFRRSKLTEADIPVIRASKESRAALAAHYGVGRASIWKIQERRSWSHVK